MSSNNTDNTQDLPAHTGTGQVDLDVTAAVQAAVAEDISFTNNNNNDDAVVETPLQSDARPMAVQVELARLAASQAETARQNFALLAELNRLRRQVTSTERTLDASQLSTPAGPPTPIVPDSQTSAVVGGLPAIYTAVEDSFEQHNLLGAHGQMSGMDFIAATPTRSASEPRRPAVLPANLPNPPPSGQVADSEDAPNDRAIPPIDPARSPSLVQSSDPAPTTSTIAPVPALPRWNGSSLDPCGDPSNRCPICGAPASDASIADAKRQREDLQERLRAEIRDELYPLIYAEVRTELYPVIYAEIFAVQHDQFTAAAERDQEEFKREFKLQWASNNPSAVVDHSARRKELSDMGVVQRGIAEGDQHQSERDHARTLDLQTSNFKMSGPPVSPAEPRRESMMTSKAKDAAKTPHDRGGTSVYTARQMKHPSVDVEDLNLRAVQDLLAKCIMWEQQLGAQQTQPLTYLTPGALKKIVNQHNKVLKSPHKRTELGLHPRPHELTEELALFATGYEAEQIIRLGLCPENTRGAEALLYKGIQAVERKHGLKLNAHGRLNSKDISKFQMCLHATLALTAVTMDWYPQFSMSTLGGKPVLSSHGIAVKANPKMGSIGVLAVVFKMVGFGPSKTYQPGESGPHNVTLRGVFDATLAATEGTMTKTQLESSPFAVGRTNAHLRAWSNATDLFSEANNCFGDLIDDYSRESRVVPAGTRQQRDDDRAYGTRSVGYDRDPPRAPPRDRSRDRPSSLQHIEAHNRQEMVHRHEELMAESLLTRYNPRRDDSYEGPSSEDDDRPDERRSEREPDENAFSAPYIGARSYEHDRHLIRDPIQREYEAYDDRYGADNSHNSHRGYDEPRRTGRHLANIQSHPPSGDSRTRYESNAPLHARPPDRNGYQQDRQRDQQRRDPARDQPREREQGRHDARYPAPATPYLVDPRARPGLSTEKAASYGQKPCYGHLKGQCQFAPGKCPFNHSKAVCQAEYNAIAANMDPSKHAPSLSQSRELVPASPNPQVLPRPSAPALRQLQQGQDPSERNVHWNDDEARVAELSFYYHRELASMQRREFEYNRERASEQRRDSEQQYAGRDPNQLILGYADGEVVGEYGDSSGHSSEADP